MAFIYCTFSNSDVFVLAKIISKIQNYVFELNRIINKCNFTEYEKWYIQ